jgi:ABC-type glutathione transport system ATPase component
VITSQLELCLPVMPDSAVLVEVRDLRKVFRTRDAAGRRTELVAVDGVSFLIPAGESLALVGETGSGKTTVARMIMGLEVPTSGQIAVCGRSRDTRARGAAERKRRGREVQIVYQDPYSSLDPRQTVQACLAEVLDLHFSLSREERGSRVAQLLLDVGLDERIAREYPRTLSGGQRQRVAIARALAAEPSVVILDEAVAALDVSIQAQVLNLLAEVREKTGTSYLLISHDLGVVRQLTSETVVLQNGRIVEAGPTAQVLDSPEHPYTQLLRDSIPRPGWKPRRRARLAAAEA